MASYPTKPHTRANTQEFYVYLLSLFDDDEIFSARKGLQTEFGENPSLSQFIGMPPEDFSRMEYTGTDGLIYMSKRDTRLIKSIHSWIRYEFHNRPKIDVTTLTLDDYDAFLLDKPPDTPSGNVGLIQQSTNYPTTPGANNPVQQINFSPFGAPSLTGTASFMPNVKLDVKQYPTFNGDNASWIKFKRGVLSIASTHGLDEVFDTNTTVPTVGDPSYLPYMEKNKFVYSIWISRVTGGLAMSILWDFEDTRDGRGVYLKLLNMYEGKHNTQQMALLAMVRLNSLFLNYNTTGGMPTFITKFRDALHDLKDAKEPLSDNIAK